MKQAFAKALRKARKSRGLTQEDFSTISSRTYLSTLERGQKSPTLDKVEALSKTMDIHALSLMMLAYLHKHPDQNIQTLLDQVANEVAHITRNDGTDQT